MKDKVVRTSIVLAVVALTLIPAWGKDYKFQIPTATSLHGVALEPGQYKLKVDEKTSATLEKDGQAILTTSVVVEDLARKLYGARLFFGKDGELTELHIKDKKVLFPGSETIQARLNP